MKKFEDGKKYEVEGVTLNEVNTELLKVDKYRNRKNEYKSAYIDEVQETTRLKLLVDVLEEDIEGLVLECEEWEEENDTLKADLVSYDELVDEQRKVINELTDMCQTYSKFVNELQEDLLEVQNELTATKGELNDAYKELDEQDDYIAELEDSDSEVTFPQAVDRFCEELSGDKSEGSVYYAYQSNIAMSFSDQLGWWGYKLPQQHRICNEAAKQFLDLLIRVTQDEE